MKKDSFLDIMDFCFVVEREKIAEAGEDSFLYSVNDRAGIIGAFDGCGGSGAKKYSEFHYRTGAYISSRVLADVVDKWFSENWANSGEFSENMAESLKERIDTQLQGIYASLDKGDRLLGNMSKDLPSTLAVTLASGGKKAQNAMFLWAGDSRCYILDIGGLHQATLDDVAQKDAMLNLREDCGMTNVVSASHRYVIHEKFMKIKTPCILIAATDGCFGYLESPMEFERMLLGTLMGSQNIQEWKTKLDQFMEAVAGDDYTLCVMALGFGSFQKLQTFFQGRNAFMDENYPVGTASSEEELYGRWMTYKPEYEKYLQNDI